MKRSSMITLVLALVFILGFYGVAFSGGGEPCPGCCDNPPAPTSGQYLYGTFTVARDKSEASTFPDYAGYDVQIVLQYKLNQHLFSFFAPLGDGHLCAVKVSNPDLNRPGLKEMFGGAPCALEVGKAFGFDPTKYFPVISDVYIAKKDFCDTPQEMILGLITIRLVPIK